MVEKALRFSFKIEIPYSLSIYLITKGLFNLFISFIRSFIFIILKIIISEKVNIIFSIGLNNF